MRLRLRATCGSGLAAVVIAVTSLGCSSPDDSTPPQANSTADFDAVMECIHERGWEAVAHDDDSIGSPLGLPEGQLDAYSADVDECLAIHFPPVEPEDVSDERWQEFYEETIESAECLREQGYDIPEAPSLPAFRDSYFTGDATDQWVPWMFVPVSTLDRGEFEALEGACPQVLL